MVHVVFHSDYSLSKKILCILSNLPLDNGSAERRGKTDHGEKCGIGHPAEMRFRWTNETACTKIRKTVCLKVLER